MTANKSTLALLLLLAAPAAFGSTARIVSFDEKVAAADSIVLAECVSSRSELDASGRWIVTKSTFRVKKNLKGEGESQVTLVTPGGEHNGIRQETIGVPQCAPGETNVVFVRKGTPAGATVLYYDQGAYKVEKMNGEDVVLPVASQLVLIDPQTGKASQPDRRPRKLSDFEREVRVAIDKQRNVPMKAASVDQTKGHLSLTAAVRENLAIVLLATLVLAGAVVYAFKRNS